MARKSTFIIAFSALCLSVAAISAVALNSASFVESYEMAPAKALNYNYENWDAFVHDSVVGRASDYSNGYVTLSGQSDAETWHFKFANYTLPVEAYHTYYAEFTFDLDFEGSADGNVKLEGMLRGEKKFESGSNHTFGSFFTSTSSTANIEIQFGSVLASGKNIVVTVKQVKLYEVNGGAVVDAEILNNHDGRTANIESSDESEAKFTVTAGGDDKAYALRLAAKSSLNMESGKQYYYGYNVKLSKAGTISIVHNANDTDQNRLDSGKDYKVVTEPFEANYDQTFSADETKRFNMEMTSGAAADYNNFRVVCECGALPTDTVVEIYGLYVLEKENLASLPVVYTCNCESGTNFKTRWSEARSSLGGMCNTSTHTLNEGVANLIKDYANLQKDQRDAISSLEDTDGVYDMTLDESISYLANRFGL